MSPSTAQGGNTEPTCPWLWRGGPRALQQVSRSWHTLTGRRLPRRAQTMDEWGQPGQPSVLPLLTEAAPVPAADGEAGHGRALCRRAATLGRGLGRAGWRPPAPAMGALRRVSLATRLTGSSLPFRNPARHPDLGAHPNSELPKDDSDLELPGEVSEVGNVVGCSLGGPGFSSF